MSDDLIMDFDEIFILIFGLFNWLLVGLIVLVVEDLCFVFEVVWFLCLWFGVWICCVDIICVVLCYL